MLEFIKIKIKRRKLKKVAKRKAVTLKKAERLADIDTTVSTLERLWVEIDSKAVIYGSINFLTGRLTGFRFFKDRLEKKDKDKSNWIWFIELIKEFINKIRRTEQ